MSANDTPPRRYQPRTIAEVMTLAPYTVGRDQPLSVARSMFHSHRIRHLPVLDGGQLIGVVSERDIALVEALRDVDVATLVVEDAMSPQLFFVAPDALLSEVAAHMAEHALGSAVVQEDGKVVGVFTTVDALRVLSLAMADG